MGRPKKVLEQFEDYVKDVPDIQKTKDDLIPSGLTLLNCACSDNCIGAYKMGSAVNLVGDSNTGKSLFGITALACCANMERFNDYKFKYCDAESSFSFDIRYLFGEKTYKRVKFDDVEYPALLETVESNTFKMLEQGKSFIYVVDSLDALRVAEDVKKMKHLEKEGEIKSGYHLEKPKKLGSFLGSVLSGLKETKSLIILISQTRSNIGFGAKFNPKIKAGGAALTFYSNQEIWISNEKKRKIDFNGSKKTIGNNIRIKVKRTRLTGKQRELTGIPTFYDLGVDDVRANIEWLCKEGFWPANDEFKKPKHYTISDFSDIILPIDGIKNSSIFGEFPNIIDFIEKNGLESELQKIVGRRWLELEEKLMLTTRKKRFE